MLRLLPLTCLPALATGFISPASALKAAGIAIGIVGDAGVRANAQQAKLYVGMVLILIFAEARAHPRSARCGRLRGPIASRRAAPLGPRVRTC